MLNLLSCESMLEKLLPGCTVEMLLPRMHVKQSRPISTGNVGSCTAPLPRFIDKACPHPIEFNEKMRCRSMIGKEDGLPMVSPLSHMVHPARKRDTE